MHDATTWIRSKECEELQKDIKAFALITKIAWRAARKAGTVITRDGHAIFLEAGEALIGDHLSCGLTQQEYRSAKNRLRNCKYAAFRTTNRGTIARLLDTRIYDINIAEPTTCGTSSQPADNEQPTTNKNAKNLKKKENKQSTLPGVLATINGIELKTSFWVWLINECHGNKNNAARILYQAKTAKTDSIERYIQTALYDGVIDPEKPGDDNYSSEERDWIQKFLAYIESKCG